MNVTVSRGDQAAFLHADARRTGLLNTWQSIRISKSPPAETQPVIGASLMKPLSSVELKLTV
ncbi:MAG TPA: hypothetical protein VFS23_18075 [Vicinamibacterales bacterium]|nr:hypothetical protein [Vicinamibacterales bacterium]